VSPPKKLEAQLNLVKNAITNNCLILRDFNIDHSKKYINTYVNKHLFTLFDDIMSHLGLYQHINFPTWSRMINGTLKESVLNHIYSKNPICISNFYLLCPIFGNHLLVIFDFLNTIDVGRFVWKRDWHFYRKERLTRMLTDPAWDINVPDVQQYWNIFENKLLSIFILYNEAYIRWTCHSYRW
jgi:hypothetical protein